MTSKADCLLPLVVESKECYTILAVEFIWKDRQNDMRYTFLKITTHSVSAVLAEWLIVQYWKHYKCCVN